MVDYDEGDLLRSKIWRHSFLAKSTNECTHTAKKHRSDDQKSGAEEFEPQVFIQFQEIWQQEIERKNCGPSTNSYILNISHDNNRHKKGFQEPYQNKRFFIIGAGAVNAQQLKPILKQKKCPREKQKGTAHIKYTYTQNTKAPSCGGG